MVSITSDIQLEQNKKKNRKIFLTSQPTSSRLSNAFFFFLNLRKPSKFKLEKCRFGLHSECRKSSPFFFFSTWQYFLESINLLGYYSIPLGEKQDDLSIPLFWKLILSTQILNFLRKEGNVIISSIVTRIIYIIQ